MTLTATTLTAMAQSQRLRLFSEPAESTTLDVPEIVPLGGPEVVRERPVIIDFEALNATVSAKSKPYFDGAADLDDTAGAANDTSDSPSLLLNLFADIELPVVFDRTEGNKSGSRTWIGRIENVQYSSVTLVVKDGVMIGNIAVGDRIYQVGFVGDDVHMVREIDQSTYPPEADPEPVFNLPDPPSVPGDVDSSVSEGDASIFDGRETMENMKEMDILVVYTTAAKNIQGGQAAIENLIDTAVSETNTGYINSGINQRLNLAHTAEVNYTESGNIETDRNRLKDPSDAYMDTVHALRDTYTADLVTLIVDNGGGYCGIAYIQETVALTFEDSAFNVVNDDCATGYYSFGHELGHIMGARHDWYVDATADSPFSYNHGYVNESVQRRSVMAYNNDCVDSGIINCTRYNWWSNPDDGPSFPWGIREDTSTSCTSFVDNPGCDADNRKTLNNTGFTVANFRVRDDVIGASREFDSGAAENNSQDGIMFNLTAKQTTTIHGFSSVFDAGPIDRIEIYYREGSYSGHDTDPSAWKLVGSANDLAVQASPAQTHIPIDMDIEIPAGQTYAFYVTAPNSPNVQYADGSSEGTLYAENDALQLFEGRGKAYPFGSSFTPRIFSGTVYHSYANEVNLLTTDAPNNGQDGIMFDVTAKSRVRIHGFSSYISTITSSSGGWVDGMEVYFRPGTHVGHENSSTGWTKLGPVNNVVGSNISGASVFAQNRLPIPVDVTIPAGETYAFYVTTTGAGLVLYENGSSVGAVYASDANINVREGTGKSYPFDTSFTPRVFAGTVHTATKSKIGVYRSSNHRFYLDMDGSNGWSAGDVVSASFGLSGDEPVSGDWNGDGVNEIGVYRPSNNRFYLDMDGSNGWSAGDVVSASFGLSNDEPVSGDWNGDGVDEIGVYRSSNHRFYLDMDGSNGWSAGDVVSAPFGLSNDEPVSGDWNGDGVDEIGVYRPSNPRFYLDMDGSNGWSAGDVVSARFGLSNDEPVTGKW